jgi:hypothetical protein
VLWPSPRAPSSPCAPHPRSPSMSSTLRLSLAPLRRHNTLLCSDFPLSLASLTFLLWTLHIDGGRGTEEAGCCPARGKTRGGGSGPTRWRTRGGGGETAARRRLSLAWMGKRGGGGSAAVASLGGAGEQVGPSSPRALLSLRSDFSRAPLSTVLILPCAPLSISARDWLSRAPALSPSFLPRSRVFLPRPSPYGARLARSGTNWTPNR